MITIPCAIDDVFGIRGSWDGTEATATWFLSLDVGFRYEDDVLSVLVEGPVVSRYDPERRVRVFESTPLVRHNMEIGQALMGRSDGTGLCIVSDV